MAGTAVSSLSQRELNTPGTSPSFPSPDNNDLVTYIDSPNHGTFFYRLARTLRRRIWQLITAKSPSQSWRIEQCLQEWKYSVSK